jgi:hypothetical protein
MAFEVAAVRLPIAAIQPLRLVSAAAKKTTKYAQIASSIKEVGIVEPPIVARDREALGNYLLLDGHIRVDVLKDMGLDTVECLVATDDEAFTYNKRVNRLAIIQEHKMIVKAIERGVPEDRIARALNIDVRTLNAKVRLLENICSEAAELLRDKHIPTSVFWVLKRMAPLRQIECAELMIAMNKYTLPYAQSLYAATPQDQLIDRRRRKVVKGLTDVQVAAMERESANLEREFKLAEQSYGPDHLDLVSTKGYLAKLLANARVVRYLAQHHQGILSEFQRVAELESSGA